MNKSNLNSLQQAVSSPLPRKRKMKPSKRVSNGKLSILLFLGIIILIALPIGGYIWYDNYKAKCFLEDCDKTSKKLEKIIETEEQELEDLRFENDLRNAGYPERYIEEHV